MGNLRKPLQNIIKLKNQLKFKQQVNVFYLLITIQLQIIF